MEGLVSNWIVDVGYDTAENEDEAWYLIFHGELHVLVVCQVDGIRRRAVRNVLRRGTLNHDGAVVALVGDQEDRLAFRVVADDVAVLVWETGGWEASDGTALRHVGREVLVCRECRRIFQV